MCYQNVWCFIASVRGIRLDVHFVQHRWEMGENDLCCLDGETMGNVDDLYCLDLMTHVKLFLALTPNSGDEPKLSGVEMGHTNRARYAAQL